MARSNDRGWRRRSAGFSTILCGDAAGLLKASFSDHKYDMNNGDDNKDAAW